MFFDEYVLTQKKASALRTPPIPKTGWRPPVDWPDLSSASVIAFDVETKETDFDHGPGWARNKGHIVGLSIAAKWSGRGDGWSAYFPVRHEVERDWNCDCGDVFRYAKNCLETTSIPKVGANLIYDCGWLTEEGVNVKGELFDVQFAEALLDETAQVNLEALGQKYLGAGKESPLLYDWCAQAYGGAAGPGQRANIFRSPPRLVGQYAESDSSLPLAILERQWPLLAEQGLLDLFRMECASIPMLVKMRQSGVRVDVVKAEQLYHELGGTIERLYVELATLAGQPIESVSAASQIARVFDAHSITYPRTADGAPSFRKEWLTAHAHPIAAKINAIRETEKIRGTFLKSYILDSHNNGRIHCQFHPLRGDDGGAKTGRYSCVAGHTQVATPNGTLAIKALPVGSLVWTHKGRWRRVLARYIKGVGQMFDIILSNGHVLTCTGDHRLLLSTGEWATVREMEDVYFKAMGCRPTERLSDGRSLSRSTPANGGASSSGAWHNLSQRFACHKEKYSHSGAESAGGATLLSFKGGGEESDVWEVRGRTSELGRRLRRRLRLPNCVTRWGSAVFASCNYGARAWFRKIARYFRGASYRHRPEEQSSRQSCARNKSWPQKYTLFAGEGQPIVTVEKINLSGSYKVYDITVEEDESYQAEGVFSHNSSNPNMQNIPVRTKLGKKIRNIFIPDEGHMCWQKSDHSQIEYRMLANFATGPGADELRQTYNNDRRTDYHDRVFKEYCEQVGLDYANMPKEEKATRRKPLKSINFGLIYGQSQPSLAFKAGMSKQDADEFFETYHASAPYVKPTMAGIAADVQRDGFIQTILGRRVRFNLWEPRRHEKGVKPLPYAAARAVYGTNIKRAGDYKGTNYKFQGSAADVMKAGMLWAYKDGVFDVIGYPRMQVHDELNFSVIDDSPQQNEAYAYMIHCLENAVPQLRVPLYVDTGRGPDWGSAD